jgi:UDP-N-acetylmuramoylalanine--D-glutamate ligase
VGELLKYAGKTAGVGGNLGTPALDLLQDPPPDFYVLELSSFQLESTESLAPQAAAILNISPDHMDRYPHIEAYAASKARIYRQARHVIVNRDDPAVAAIAANYPGHRTAFTVHVPDRDEFGLVGKDGEIFLAYGERLLAATGELRLEGGHNWTNALAALALVQAAGVSPDRVLPALRSFAGLPHRCQWVAEHNGVRWISDSKATNIGAAAAAIGSMPGSIVLIAGGDGKGADFSELRKTVHGKVKAAVLLGKDAPLLEGALSNATVCVRVADMQAAVEQAVGLAEPGDTVLLAPACASLDMYTNYMARGDDFSRRVRQLIERLRKEGQA